MAISSRAAGSDAETSLLEDKTVDSAVDYKGRRASRRNSGGWRSTGYIIAVEIAERFAYYGISINLIMYLTGPLGQSTADAAISVNVWRGTASVLPLLGAFVADSFLGRYRTVAITSLLYVFGLGLLTLSTFPSSDSDCQGNHTAMSCSPSSFQVGLFFFSLYLVAAAQGGHKPSTQAFGADQFDSDDPEECKSKSSFFNWWYVGVCSSIFTSTLVVSYIQENFSWGLGFGVLCVAMATGFVVFLFGTKTYRFNVAQINGKEPITRISKVFVAAFNNRRENSSFLTTNIESGESLSHRGSQQFNFLNKATRVSNGMEEVRLACSVAEVNEAKAVLRLFPIWASCLVYGVVLAQTQTFFTKQAATMDRVIFSDFKVPAAYIHCIGTASVLVSLTIYDRVLVPIARSFTGKPSGITMLQRIGTGIFISVILMITAALVESKRLKTAKEHGLVDEPNATIPMSIWWMAPQIILFGVADVFTLVGMQEFFYDQVPTELRSIGIALYLSISGVGSFVSSFLVWIIERTTTGVGGESWFANNLNRGRLDCFYWLLAGLCALGFGSLLHFARSYIYNKELINSRRI